MRTLMMFSDSHGKEFGPGVTQPCFVSSLVALYDVMWDILYIAEQCNVTLRFWLDVYVFCTKSFSGQICVVINPRI